MRKGGVPWVLIRIVLGIFVIFITSFLLSGGVAKAKTTIDKLIEWVMEPSSFIGWGRECHWDGTTCSGSCPAGEECRLIGPEECECRTECDISDKEISLDTERIRYLEYSTVTVDDLDKACNNREGTIHLNRIPYRGVELCGEGKVTAYVKPWLGKTFYRFEGVCKPENNPHESTQYNVYIKIGESRSRSKIVNLEVRYVCCQPIVDIEYRWILKAQASADACYPEPASGEHCGDGNSFENCAHKCTEDENFDHATWNERTKICTCW